MLSNLLEGYTVLDLSHRLPGPVAGMLLAQMGAKVIKIEDEVFQDAFVKGLFEQMDDAFVDCYDELNKDKEIVRFAFKGEDAREKMAAYLEQADGIIQGLPPKVQMKLGVDQESLKEKEIAVVHMAAAKNFNKSLHDINAMAETGLLSLFIAGKHDDIVNPPYLAFSGIAFGHQIAAQLSTAMVKAKLDKKLTETTAYLFDTAKALYEPFWSPNLQKQKRVSFLQNGAFPCYNLYRTKDDHYVALAAVEEKFWIEVNEMFAIGIEAGERFNTDKSYFDKVLKAFNTKTLDEIESIMGDKDLCLTAVRRVEA